MTWFFAVLAIVAMAVAAVLATGRGGQLSQVFDDRPESRVPDQGPLGSGDLAAVRFSTAFRGYRMDEVDALLDRLVAELERRDAAEQPAPPAEGA